MSYRQLATRPVVYWCLVSVAARMPVTMASLAMVFLLRDRPGGYALGAGLAAVYIVGEVLGAAVLGSRMTPDRARNQMAAGLAVGAAAFAGLGLLAQANPLLLGALALVAGAAPAAAQGGMRTLLLSLVPESLAPKALSVETILVFSVWAATPALTAGLALTVGGWLPMLVAAALMAVSTAGLWLLPAGWPAHESDRGGVSVARTLLRAWPVYLTGAAGMALVALAELVLAALLEQRGLGVGWTGPLLTGYAVASAVGAWLYGAKTRWPGPLRVQSMVLLVVVTGCVVVVALVPSVPVIAAALLIAGVTQAGLMLTRNLALRELLPPSTHAAGYSMMFAVIGVGYGVSAGLAGLVQYSAAPSTAILAGVALTVLATVAIVFGELRLRRAPAVPADSGRTTTE